LPFVKTQVVERELRKGKRVATKKKRKLKAKAEDSKKKKQRGQEARTLAKAKKALSNLKASNSKKELKSKLCYRRQGEGL